ncbi:MAG: mechanosensitive ion channel domain-containing protein, partial [Bacteroidota bacterium]
MSELKNLRIILFTLFISFGFSGLSQQKVPGAIHIEGADSIKGELKGYPVNPFGEVLFYIHSNLGPYSPSVRAKGLEGKIKELGKDPFFHVDSLAIVEYEGTYNIVYQGVMVTTVTPRDSIAEKTSRHNIAMLRFEKIVEGITRYREMNSETNIIRSIVYSILVIVFLVFFFFIVNRLYIIVNKKIDTWQGNKRKIFTFLDYDFFDKTRQIIALRLINKFVRILLFFLLLISGLILMFYLLPWTKFFTMEVIKYILTPVKNFLNAIWNFVPNFLAIIVILFIMTLINRFFRFLKGEVEKGALKIPGFYTEWALPTYNIIRVIVWIFTFIVIWPYIPGSDSKIFQGISVFLGLVFSLTSASLVSNLMAGFTLTYTRAFKMGDRIRIGDMVGDVTEKSMLVTKIKTIKNEEITIPNAKIMSSEVINYSTAAPNLGLILNTSVTIGYDAPWRKVHELLINAAL